MSTQDANDSEQEEKVLDDWDSQHHRYWDSLFTIIVPDKFLDAAGDSQNFFDTTSEDQFDLCDTVAEEEAQQQRAFAKSLELSGLVNTFLRQISSGKFYCAREVFSNVSRSPCANSNALFLAAEPLIKRAAETRSVTTLEILCDILTSDKCPLPDVAIPLLSRTFHLISITAVPLELIPVVASCSGNMRYLLKFCTPPVCANLVPFLDCMQPIPSARELRFLIQELRNQGADARHAVDISNLFFHHPRLHMSTEQSWELLKDLIFDGSFFIEGSLPFSILTPPMHELRKLIRCAMVNEMKNILRVLALCEGYPYGLPSTYFAKESITSESLNDPDKLCIALELGSSANEGMQDTPPLFELVRHKKLPCKAALFKILLEHGACVRCSAFPGSILFEMPIDEEFTEMLRLAVAYGADLDERCSPFPYSGRTPVEYWQERVTHARWACITQAQALISALVSVWREDLVAPALLYLKTLNTPIVDTHKIKELVKQIARIVVLLSSHHHRLGANSCFNLLPPTLLREMCEYLLSDGALLSVTRDLTMLVADSSSMYNSDSESEW